MKQSAKTKRRRKPKHLVALEQPYEHYIELNGGEFCGICLRKPSTKRRLDRDHDHNTGEPRGLLCHRCNRTLAHWITPEWLEAAASYLNREPIRTVLEWKGIAPPDLEPF